MHKGTQVGVISRGSMYSAIGCNANSYSVFVIATYVMHCLNFRIPVNF